MTSERGDQEGGGLPPMSPRSFSVHRNDPNVFDSSCFDLTSRWLLPDSKKCREKIMFSSRPRFFQQSSLLQNFIVQIILPLKKVKGFLQTSDTNALCGSVTSDFDPL